MDHGMLRHPSLVRAFELAGQYRAIPEVVAVVLGGSQTTGVADDRSDIDLYVYYASHVTGVPISARAAVASHRGSRIELDNRFFEPGDEWVESDTGLAVDVIFRHTGWVEEMLDRVLRRHVASLGYSTCLWANVLASHILFDRDGWFAALQAAARQPYPEPLRRAIIAKNEPMLRRAHSAYRGQLAKAVARSDVVMVNHRVAALLASYFDILFALNRLPHPGEKRLLTLAAEQCTALPSAFAATVRDLLHAAGSADAWVLAATDRLVDALDQLLVDEAITTC